VAEDFALLVAINAYPLTGYTELKGPPNDLALVRDWLINDAKVPAANIRISGSPNPAVPTSPDYPPTPNQIWGRLRDIVFDKATGAVNYRPNNRLYLYFSGHGFSSYVDERPHAALYAGNAAKLMSYNVCGTTMAQWCQRAGVFGEIVLVMDCCRDREISKRAGEPHFDDLDDPVRARNVRRFEIYAVPYGEKAQERLIPQLGQIHGLLTYAFVQALRSAQSSNGVRTANDIKGFIEGAWGTIVGEERVEQPYFVSIGRCNIEFPAGAPSIATGRIRFTPKLTEAAQLHIINPDNQAVVRVELSPGQRTVFELIAGGAGKSSAFDGEQLSLDLPLAVYKLTLQRANQPDVSTLWTMLGDTDAELAL
jgi:hypothetical protein